MADGEQAAVARWIRTPIVAGVVLMVTYVLASLATSPFGFLGTDTGGKVATVSMMSERGDFDPDVEYWAAEWDPDARVHGLYFTSRIGDRFVNVTTLPMVLAARPLYDLGGYRAALLLPMLGAVATAFAARAMARRLRAGEDGWSAFWIVGLASPVAVYALDLWEHAPGLGLMAWGVVALFDSVFDRPVLWRGLLAGLAFGAAASMRTESFVYALTSTALACAALAFTHRRDIVGGFVTGAGAVVGFALALGANLALEIAVLAEPLRSTRASRAAASGLSELELRVREGLVTTLSPLPTMSAHGWVMGACLLVALVYVARTSRRGGGDHLAVVAATAAGLIVVWRIVDGLGFVPGMVAATPFAAVGLAWGLSEERSRFAVLLATVPLPLVFLFQYTGGAAPQWAGRYILLSGFLLAVVGVVHRDRLAPWARRGFVGVSVVLTAFGFSWLVVRSHEIAAAADRLQARAEPVLVSPNGFVPREFGASYGEKDWLAAGSDEDLHFAVDVVAAAGLESFALVDLDTVGDPPAFSGWTAVATEDVPFLSGVDLRVTTYRSSGAE